MLAYQLKLAWLSLRRTPVLSSLLVAGIALGIGVATAFVGSYHVLAANPAPEQGRHLYYVQLDSWNPDRPWDDDAPEEPPNQLTWVDAQGVLESEIPTHQAAMFKASLTVHPTDREQRPFRARTRVTTAGFFAMFEVPFLFGGSWPATVDERPEPVVVLNHDTNLKLFGGEDSVGRHVRIEDRDFRVVGVLQPWRPMPKYYDPHNNPYETPDELFVPLSLTPGMEINTAGNTSGWKFTPGDAFADFLASEDIWLQMWVQIDTPEQKQEYTAFLDAYAREQKAVGRFERPLNNRLRSVPEWLELMEVVPDEAKTSLIISLLFLVVCSVNLIGILLGKFLARAPEVGVRRALGASRRWVFAQHLIECELVGLLGGASGIVLSVGVIALLNRFLYDPDNRILALESEIVGVGLLLALAAGLVAGLYPAWRICRVAPASYLKQQ